MMSKQELILVIHTLLTFSRDPKSGYVEGGKKLVHIRLTAGIASQSGYFPGATKTAWGRHVLGAHTIMIALGPGTCLFGMLVRVPFSNAIKSLSQS